MKLLILQLKHADIHTHLHGHHNIIYNFIFKSLSNNILVFNIPPSSPPSTPIVLRRRPWCRRFHAPSIQPRSCRHSRPSFGTAGAASLSLPRMASLICGSQDHDDELGRELVPPFRAEATAAAAFGRSDSEPKAATIGTYSSGVMESSAPLHLSCSTTDCSTLRDLGRPFNLLDSSSRVEKSWCRGVSSSHNTATPCVP